MIEILLFTVLALVVVNLVLSVVLLVRKQSNAQPDHRSEYLKRQAERDKRRAAIRKRAAGGG